MAKKSVRSAKKAPKKAAKKAVKKKGAKKKAVPRANAADASRRQLHEALRTLVMSATALSEAKTIIEEEVRGTYRAMLEEWYLDHPSDFIEDSGLDIDLEANDGLRDSVADYVGSLDDETVERSLEQWL